MKIDIIKLIKATLINLLEMAVILFFGIVGYESLSGSIRYLCIIFMVFMLVKAALSIYTKIKLEIEGYTLIVKKDL